jgi:hypothetical protein
VTLVPFLKYPPNPPAVGYEETLRDRTAWYLLMVLLSVALAIASVWLGRRLLARLGAWSATLIAVAVYLLAIAVAMLVLPTVAEIPDGFPADVLYDFRLYSLGTELVTWAGIGVVFASLVGRLPGERPRDGQTGFGRAASIAA